MIYEIDGIEAIAAMVERGLGISLLPDWKSPWPERPIARQTVGAGGPLLCPPHRAHMAEGFASPSIEAGILGAGESGMRDKDSG